MLHVAPGSTVARYRIDALVGAGGMGVVYRGHDERLRRPVAIKLLGANRLDDASRQRFRGEALLLSRLNHPNIATVFEFGEHDGVDYLVMELVAGRTLDALLASGPLPVAQVTALGAQLARGLAAAHAAGIVHRDIKPSNLRVTPEGLLKILDFGIAVGPSPLAPGETTHSGAPAVPRLSGTLGYMAPERLRGDADDARADIFSAGVVLYEMACGRQPFPARHPVRRLESILLGRIEPPRRLVPALPRALERAILLALASDSRRRYQSADVLAVDLDQIRLRASRPALPVVRRLRALTHECTRLAACALKAAM
jgi:serine/threonine-protein kinase